MENYKQHREKAIQWVDSKERDFNEGLKILQDSRYKPIAVKNIVRLGTGTIFAKEKMLALMYEIIRMWYYPEYEKQDEQPIEEANQEPEPQSDEQIEEKYQGYPSLIRRSIHEFYALMKERRKLKAEADAIIGTDDAAAKQRNEMYERVESISERMDYLFMVKGNFEKDKTVPTVDEYENKQPKPIAKKKELFAPDATIDDLKKLKKNLKTQLLRKHNYLDYQTETKQDKPNPIPQGPKRLAYEKKVKRLEADIEKVEYRIAELS